MGIAGLIVIFLFLFLLSCKNKKKTVTGVLNFQFRQVSSPSRSGKGGSGKEPGIPISGKSLRKGYNGSPLSGSQKSSGM